MEQHNNKNYSLPLFDKPSWLYLTFTVILIAIGAIICVIRGEMEIFIRSVCGEFGIIIVFFALYTSITPLIIRQSCNRIKTEFSLDGSEKILKSLKIPKTNLEKAREFIKSFHDNDFFKIFGIGKFKLIMLAVGFCFIIYRTFYWLGEWRKWRMQTPPILIPTIREFGAWLYICWLVMCILFIYTIIIAVGIIAFLIKLCNLASQEKIELKIDPLHRDRMGGLEILRNLVTDAFSLLAVNGLAIPAGFFLLSYSFSMQGFIAIIFISALIFVVLYGITAYYIHEVLTHYKNKELDKRRNELNRIREEIRNAAKFEEFQLLSGKERIIREEIEEIKRTMMEWPRAVSYILKLFATGAVPTLAYIGRLFLKWLFIAA